MFQEDAQKQTEVLSQAKDRAQVTATGAMSVVQVALLRQVIDSGPDNNRYYMTSIWLIAASLVCQVIAGIISIFVSNLSSYFEQFGGQPLKDCMTSLCCCKVVGKTKRKNRPKKFGLGFVEAEEKRLSLIDIEDEQEKHFCCPCCPCEITSEVMDKNEVHILRSYDDWTRQQTNLTLQTEAANLEKEHLTKVITSAKQQLAQLESSMTADDGSTEQKSDIQNTFDEATRKRQEFELKILNKKISDAQGVLLRKEAQSIRKKRVYKMATFWQHILNYIFYTLFVMQAFITGLTITNDMHLTVAATGEPNTTITPGM